MRVQLSFEFLVYVGIAMASMVAMLGLYIRGDISLSSYNAQAELESFVAGVNANIAIQRGSFYAYIPKGMCNISASNGSILYRNITYLFYGNVSLQLGSICSNSAIALVHTDMLQNGTLLVN